jgi:hypothetical protein
LGELREAEGVALLNRLDGMSGLRGALTQIAERDRLYSGIPVPLDDQNLVLEPTFPNREVFESFGPQHQTMEQAGQRHRNTFYSHRYRCDVHVWEEGGKIAYGVTPAVHSLTLQLQTLGASDAWGLEQEQRALKLLGTMIRHRQFKQYLLTGCFMESSKRSGVRYLFRKLRPTVAIRDVGTDDLRVLATLCLHPLGFYSRSFAGAMCPTDDVVAHLALMRADEHLFWRKCNQHSAHRPEAGI